MSRRTAQVAGKNERRRKLARDAHQRRIERQVQRARRAKQISVSAIVAVIVVAVGVLAAVIAGAFSSTQGLGERGGEPSGRTPSVTPSATPSPSNTAAMVERQVRLHQERPGLPQGKPAAGEAGHQGHLRGDGQDQSRHDRDRPAEQQGAVHGGVVCLTCQPALLQQHAMPPAHHNRHLRASVRRPAQGPGRADRATSSAPRT